MPGAAVLDPAVLERLRQLTPPGEPDVLAEVLRIFLDDASKRVARLEEAWRQGDAAAVQRVAHSLKGSAGNIGAAALGDACRRVEERGAAGRLAGGEPALEALLAAHAAVEAEIRRVLRIA